MYLVYQRLRRYDDAKIVSGVPMLVEIWPASNLPNYALHVFRAGGATAVVVLIVSLFAAEVSIPVFQYLVVVNHRNTNQKKITRDVRVASGQFF